MFILAIAAGAYQLGSGSILLDESTSVDIARTAITALPAKLLGGDANMRLYYVLLNFWVKVFGESEAAVRSLSVLFAALAAATVCVIGARLVERRVGLLAGVLFALNAFVVRFAQTARGYTLLAFLASLSTLLFIMQLEKPARRIRIAYIAISALAVYAHFFAVLVLAAHFAVTLLDQGARKSRNAWIVDASVIAFLCIPAMVAAYGAGTTSISWIPPLSLHEAGSVFSDLAADSWVLFTAFVVAAIFVAFFPREGDGLTRTVFLAWLLIPIGLAGLMSLARPVFQSNYLIFCLAPLVLITSVAVFRVSHRIGQSALVLGLIGLCAIQLSRYYAHPSVQDWRRASLHVFQFERPGDAIVFYPEFAHKPFDYYARRFAPAYVPRNDSGPANRTWLMIRGSDARMHPDDVSRIQADLGKSATAIERSRFHLVDVELYVR